MNIRKKKKGSRWGRTYRQAMQGELLKWLGMRGKGEKAVTRERHDGGGGVAGAYANTDKVIKGEDGKCHYNLMQGGFYKHWQFQDRGLLSKGKGGDIFLLHGHY